jgi:glycosyltransferase involved in cell wall biosynthesis
MARRVLHLIHCMDCGGAEMWIMNLLRMIDPLRYRIDICCKGAGPSTGSLTSEAESLGAKVLHCELKPTHLSFRKNLMRLLKDGNYDILHVHAGSFSGYPVFLGKKCGLSVVVTYHSTNLTSQAWGPKHIINLMRYFYTRWSTKTAFKQSDYVLACSQTVLDKMREQFDIIIQGNQKIWHCGVPVPTDVPKDRQSFLRNELDLNTSKIVIHVGSFRPPKNHDQIIKVAEKVVKSEPSVKFLLVGDGSLRPQVERQIKQLNLQDNVLVLGQRSDVYDLLAIADVFFFPSKWEGLPVTVVEAQMCSLPVVASDIPQNQEAVLPGKTALLFPVEDTEGMTAALLKLLSDEKYRTQMGLVARDYARNEFSIEMSATRLCEFYDSLPGRNQRDL